MLTCITVLTQQSVRRVCVDVCMHTKITIVKWHSINHCMLCSFAFTSHILVYVLISLLLVVMTALIQYG